MDFASDIQKFLKQRLKNLELLLDSTKVGLLRYISARVGAKTVERFIFRSENKNFKAIVVPFDR